jgi:hypothetical protein
MRPIGFLVTKILGSDPHSFFSTDEEQEFLVSSNHIIPDDPDPGR